MTQDTLKELGVNVNLGSRDIKIRNALIMYASKKIEAGNGRTLRTGLYARGELQL